MIDDLFFGLQCFRNSASVPEQLEYLHQSITKLLDSGCEDGPRLRRELMNAEMFLVGCATLARRQEEQAQAMLARRLEEGAEAVREAFRPRLPRWMRSNYRGGV